MEPGSAHVPTRLKRGGDGCRLRGGVCASLTGLACHPGYPQWGLCWMKWEDPLLLVESEEISSSSSSSFLYVSVCPSVCLSVCLLFFFFPSPCFCLFVAFLFCLFVFLFFFVLFFCFFGRRGGRGGGSGGRGVGFLQSVLFYLLLCRSTCPYGPFSSTSSRIPPNNPPLQSLRSPTKTFKCQSDEPPQSLGDTCCCLCYDLRSARSTILLKKK